MWASVKLVKFAPQLAMAAVIGVAVAALPRQGVADTLHGYCLGLPGTDCQDNGNVTAIITTDMPNFSFSKAGGGKSFSGTGTFYLDILLPDSLSNPASITVNALGGTQFTSASSDELGDWTSGNLADFLNRNVKNPNNPIGAWLGLTRSFQHSANGYNVYDFNFGKVNYAVSDPSFKSPFALPAGAVITAFLCASSPKGGGGASCIGTPNSAAMMIETGHNTSVPEPMSLSLLGAGLVGMGALRRRNRRSSR